MLIVKTEFADAPRPTRPPVTGLPPEPAPFSPPAPTASQVLERIGEGPAAYQVRIDPGSRGLLDSVIAFSTAAQTLSFSGFPVRVSAMHWKTRTPLRC